MSRILILKEAPYGSREESPQMTELMNGNYAGKPEACTICGGSPVVAGARYRNPLGNVDFTHHVCEPCADQYDIMHSSDKYKGEPMDIAMRLLKMPIIPNSIQQDENTYRASFKDPVSGEKLPMRAEYKESDYDPQRDELHAQIGEGENRGIDGPNIGSESPARSHVGFKTAWGDEEEIEALEDSLSADEDLPMMGRQLTTEEPYRRRGYATALYELAALAAKNKNRRIVPSFDLTNEGEKFWGDKAEWPVKTGEPMDIAMRLLKAYLPTLQEKGRKIDDQVSLRWIPRFHESTFYAPVPFHSSRGNVNWEQRLRNEKLNAPKGSAHSKRETLPGVFEGDSKTPSNNPITGSWVAPATQQGAMGADVSFNDKGLLMAINENPDWWRTVQQGAAQESPAGEGFKFGGFDKEAFSKIPTPKISPISMLHYQMALENPMLEEDEVAQQFPDEHELITQFPNIKTEDIWGPPADSIINPLKVASEPMEIAMRLLKERVSPEAKRHKLEYDKKYESSPERVKYREELNRERRRRHIMGQGGPDMSHTSQHTIVPEDPHTNRARHFKDKGTLL